jgi:hypothetical protein
MVFRLLVAWGWLFLVVGPRWYGCEFVVRICAMIVVDLYNSNHHRTCFVQYNAITNSVAG